MSMAALDIVIPAYNEAARIERTLQDYLEHFTSSAIHFYIVINHSTDATLAIVNDYQKQYPGRITAFNIEQAIGKGGAVCYGLKRTTASWVGYVDADDSTTAVEFEKLFHAIQQTDGAVASRFKAGAKIMARNSWMRTVVSWCARTIIRIIFWLPYSDTQCGAKIFRRQLVQSIIEKMTTTNMLFDVELLWRLRHRGADLRDVPTYWIDRPGSASLGTASSFLSASWKLLWDVFRLRWRLWFKV